MSASSYGLHQAGRTASREDEEWAPCSQNRQVRRIVTGHGEGSVHAFQTGAWVRRGLPGFAAPGADDRPFARRQIAVMMVEKLAQTGARRRLQKTVEITRREGAAIVWF